MGHAPSDGVLLETHVYGRLYNGVTVRITQGDTVHVSPVG